MHKQQQEQQMELLRKWTQEEVERQRWQIQQIKLHQALQKQKLYLEQQLNQQAQTHVRTLPTVQEQSQQLNISDFAHFSDVSKQKTIPKHVGNDPASQSHVLEPERRGQLLGQELGQGTIKVGAPISNGLEMEAKGKAKMDFSTGNCSLATTIDGGKFDMPRVGGKRAFAHYYQPREVQRVNGISPLANDGLDLTRQYI